MIYQNFHLFHDIFNTVNEHNQRLIQYLLLIPSYFDIYFPVNQKVFYNFICFIINHDFYVITFWMHYALFIITYGRNKMIYYYQLNFQLADFLRLFMMSFKSDFVKILLKWQCFISITVILDFNIIVTPKNYLFLWFIVIFFFFLLKNIITISKYSIFNWFSFFF